ncbi:MAG TPA: serine hydrolase [Ktedonobacterales bacterium]
MASLQERLDEALSALPGHFALAARRFPARGLAPKVAHTGSDQDHPFPSATAEDAVSIRAGEPMPAGRLATLPIMIELMRRADLGQLSLDEVVALRETTSTLEAVCCRMLTEDDTAATNMLLALVGMGEVNETMGRLNLPATRLALPFPAIEDAAGRDNRTSAHDVVTLLALIRSGALPGAKLIHQMLDEGGPSAGIAGGSRATAYQAAIMTGPAGSAIYCVLTASQTNLGIAQTVIKRCAQALWDAWCVEGA